MKRYINVGRNSKVRFCCKHSMTFQFYSIRTQRWCSLFKFYRGSMLNFRFSSSSYSYCPITLHNSIRCQWKQNNFLFVVHESVFVTSTMVYSISIKLPRMTQQKRTCLHGYYITIGIIMISTNRKVDVSCLRYLGLTTIVKPLNVVWMSMKACR
jgi:hypothetical protein